MRPIRGRRGGRDEAYKLLDKIADMLVDVRSC
jgi:hypothetical protein